jgi:hypothetical protein
LDFRLRGDDERSPGASDFILSRPPFPSGEQGFGPGKIPLPLQGKWVDNARQYLTKSKPIEK